MLICLLTQRRLRFLSSLQSPPLQKQQQTAASEVGPFQQKICDSLTMRMFLNAALALKSTWFKKQVIIYLQIDLVGVRGINILQNVIINFISASCLQSCICAGRARLSLPRCRDNWLTWRAVWLRHRRWGAENKCNLHARLKLLQKGDTQHLISILFQTEITCSALARMKHSMERGKKMIQRSVFNSNKILNYIKCSASFHNCLCLNLLKTFLWKPLLSQEWTTAINGAVQQIANCPIHYIHLRKLICSQN